MMEKFIPNTNKLILRDKNSGPIFGSLGGDINISDRCDKNKNSFAEFPHFYNRGGVNNIMRNQESYRMFSGAKEGSKFKVEEYEVYVIHYE